MQIIKRARTATRIRNIREPNALTTIVSELELGCLFLSPLLPVLSGVFIGVFPGVLLNVVLGCWFVFPCISVLSEGSILAPVVGVGVPCMVLQSGSRIDPLRGSML